MKIDLASHTVLSWLEQQAAPMTQQLIEWININSGSTHLAGLTQMQQALATAFACLDAEQSVVPCAPLHVMTLAAKQETVPLGNVLRFRKRPQAPYQVLLSGHMDTVFGAAHTFQMSMLLDDKTLSGPGAADMKGGLVIMLYALMALERSTFADRIGWEVVINADEELGSPGSASLLARAASNHQLGLVFEPALDREGTLASARKGSGKFAFVVYGKAAHAGRAFATGRNAITALAEIVVKLHQLNGQREGVTLNVGLIQGGEALNVVPDKAVCQVDIRTTSVADEVWLQDQLQVIQTEFQQREGFRIEISGNFTRPPKLFTPSTVYLYNHLQQLGKQLGIVVQWQPTGGCCDGNNLAAMGLPVIDSLGVRGGAIHSDQEFVMLDSLVERARLTALLLMSIAQGDLDASIKASKNR